MSNGMKGIVTPGLIDRVKGIVFNPAAEWPKIGAEATTSRAIYTQYVAVLAAIGPIAMFIGYSLIGTTVPFFGTYRTPIVSGIATALVTYALSFVVVFVFALIVDALAPTFGGTKDSLRALKISAYSSTPAWIAGIFHIIPSIAWIGFVAGLYGIYLLYLGLPVLMRAPQDKAVGYTATATVCIIVLWLVIGAVAASVVGAGLSSFGQSGFNTSDQQGTQMAASWLSGVFGGKTEADRQRVANSIDQLTKMGDEAKKNESESGAKQVDVAKALNAFGQIATGGAHVEPVDFHALEDLLPGSIAGMSRENTSGERNEALGVAASKASAHYSEGDKTVTVEITDMGSLSGLASLAAKFNPNLDKETDSGFERTTNVDGQLYYEKYDNRERAGEVDFIAGNRFAVSVTGSNVSMDELTGAMKQVDFDKLATLAQAK